MVQNGTLNSREAVRPTDGHTVLVTSYGSGATAGRNLGTAGYSYDFVVKLFEPLLRQCGRYELIATPEKDLDSRARAIRIGGVHPIHFCFRGLHDAVLSGEAQNVVVPAWEFPDVPDHPFAGNPQNDWVRVANESSLLVVHGEFTARAFERAGVQAPIAIVPVPTPREYFDVQTWEAGGSWRMDAPAIVINGQPSQEEVRKPAARGGLPGRPHPRPPSWMSEMARKVRGLGREGYKRLVRPMIPVWLDAGITFGVREAAREFRLRPPGQAVHQREAALNGIVFTSIFNPADGRKNWEDLLSAFLIALGDCPDATLVLKLIGRDKSGVRALLARYRNLSLAHRCRVVLLPEYLSDDQMLELVQATTYYVTSTRAEGNCLPLMNYLAAGRPAISPCHTAIGDYFTDEAGFIVESDSEPCAWPHDPQLRCRTTWHRIVWTSLAEALRRAYDTVRHDSRRYQEMSRAARGISYERHHPTSVLPRLESALARVSVRSASERALAAA
jgi:glycosyltransferase involved in cell wall biosynthesis